MPNSVTTMDNTRIVSDVAAPIVYFDGVCGLCNRLVDFLLRHDRSGELRFAPLQGETARATLPEADVRELSTIAFTADGHHWTESSAIVRILWRLGPFWKMAGTLLWLIPRPLRNLGYRLVARSRYRFFGKRETCRLPTAEERDRLLP